MGKWFGIQIYRTAQRTHCEVVNDQFSLSCFLYIYIYLSIYTFEYAFHIFCSRIQNSITGFWIQVKSMLLDSGIRQKKMKKTTIGENKQKTKQQQTDNKAKQQKRLKGKNVDNFWTIVCILAPYVNHGEINFLPKITATWGGSSLIGYRLDQSDDGTPWGLGPEYCNAYMRLCSVV